MNDEQDRNSEAVAKLAKRQNQTDQTAQAIRNVAKVGKLAPEAVGTGIKIAKGVDDLSGGALSQTAAKAINRIPGGKLAGKVAGNKLATGASNLVSLKKDNPSLDGFSKIKGNKTSSDNKEKDNNKGKTVGGYIPVDNKSESSSNSYLGSSSLSAFIEKSPFIAKIMVMVFIIGVIFIIVFASIYATIHEQEEKLKAMVISDVAEKVTKSSTIGSPAIVPVTMFFTIKDIYNNVNNLKIFNKEKPTVDSDGIASTRDSSTFGDYLESLMGKYPDEIVKAFYQLGSIFVPGGSGCNGSDCSNNPEVAFYQKITDISYRYKKLYNIELDWPLLTATILVKDKDMEEIFSSNLNSYTSRELNNLKETMSLDWDFDYKKIPGYDYLSGGDSRYDLQILAKNMVTKKTVQTCTIDSTVSKKTELVDVEDYLIEEEKELVEATAVGERKNLTLEYYLLCDGNQKYNISSTYTLDKDKYDEFLDEYLETKYYIKKNSGSSGSSGEYSMGDGTYGWPLPQGATSCRSSCFGSRIHPITGKYNNHSGDDYPAAAGTPVYAIADGIATTGYNSARGNYVDIDHGNGVHSIYMHASKIVIGNNQHVTKGQEIMKVGTTGSSTGNHLHITIQVNGVNVAPSGYIGALPACPNSCQGLIGA